MPDVPVVNCFQTLYLWPTDNNVTVKLEIASSVVNCFQTLYLWPTDNNLSIAPIPALVVVNCFQTLYLWPTDNNCCFFVVFLYWLWIAFKLCIFDLLITIQQGCRLFAEQLWIAFKLCIFDLLITIWVCDSTLTSGVVNCFQTLYLWPTDNNERWATK